MLGRRGHNQQRFPAHRGARGVHALRRRACSGLVHLLAAHTLVTRMSECCSVMQRDWKAAGLNVSYKPPVRAKADYVSRIQPNLDGNL